MKAKLEDMISISINEIDPLVGLPFPIFLHFPRNEKFIPLRHAGDPIGLNKYSFLKEKAHFSLWTKKELKEFIEKGEGVAGAVTDQLAASTHTAETTKKAAAAGPLLQPKDLEDYPSLVEDVLQDEQLDAKEKAEILSEVSQDALRVINQITARGEKAREEGFKRSKEVVDKILLVASQESDVYSEVLKIWASQEAIYHTAGVGTLSVMFAMCLGHADEVILADMVVAAVFHDVGKIDMAEVAAKPNSARTSEELEVFHGHVDKSLALIKESGLGFHPRVYRMIAQHHECYDGSGFPNSLRGNEIDETSQLLILANYFEGLISGAETGTEISPAEALQRIYDEETAADGRRRVSPELLQRLFQFMENEYEASMAMLESAREWSEKFPQR
ncbi:MAG: HD-GYP domain-containing protein [Bacteriovoracia bacterium]